MVSFIPKKVSGKYRTIADGAITNGKPVIINADGTVSQVSASAPVTTENYIGIASGGTYADTAEATIDIIGTINKDQTSLTAGQTYFVQADGTLATSADSISVIAGTAISSTELLIATTKSATPQVGLFGGGTNSSGVMTEIQKVSFATGNGTDQGGDLTVARSSVGGFGSTTRAVFTGGRSGNTRYNTTDYIAFSSTGNATDFGDNVLDGGVAVTHSNNTRGIITSMALGGNELNVSATAASINIVYYTIANTGNSTDFGDQSDPRLFGCGGGSKTKMIHSAGTNNNTRKDVIDVLNIASTGNATDFGNLAAAVTSPKGNINSSTKCFIIGGYNGSAHVSDIQTVVIESEGNATDFGDQTATAPSQSGLSNGVIGIITNILVTSKITLASTGDAVDFGDLITRDGGTSFGGPGGSASASTPNVQP